MTDFIDTLLTSMSSKFNETNADLQINLNEDKTLKWRGLHNNQYAAVKKRNKDIKRGSEKTAAATATDDPPLKSSDSSSASAAVNNNKATGVSADDVAIADVTQPIEQNSGSSDSIAIAVTQAKAVHSEGSTSTNDKMEKTAAHNNDKEKESDDVADQRPFRRTLRRKQNAATGTVGDETTRSTDDVSTLSADKNRKIALRPKRHSSAGSASENRSVSPRGSGNAAAASSEKDDTSTASANRNIMTRGQRGRAKKSNDRENSVEIQPNEQSKATRTTERKNSISHEVEEASGHHQPTPPKLRRSERMHTSTPNTDHTSASDDRSTKSDTLEAIAIDQKTNDRTEHATRSHRKRTVETEKKPNETIEIKDEEEKVNAAKPNEIDCVEIKDESEVMEVKPEEPLKTDALEADAKTVEHVQKIEDVEVIESDPIATSAATAIDSAVVETPAKNDDQLSNGSDGGAAATTTAQAKSSTAAAASRKRGRGRPNLTAKKGNLKLNMTIATRNSPVKKSPRLTSDETPFVYTIPKKDKVAAEQVIFYLLQAKMPRNMINSLLS